MEINGDVYLCIYFTDCFVVQSDKANHRYENNFKCYITSIQIISIIEILPSITMITHL